MAKTWAKTKWRQVLDWWAEGRTKQTDVAELYLEMGKHYLSFTQDKMTSLISCVNIWLIAAAWRIVLKGFEGSPVLSQKALERFWHV